MQWVGYSQFVPELETDERSNVVLKDGRDIFLAAFCCTETFVCMSFCQIAQMLKIFLGF